MKNKRKLIDKFLQGYHTQFFPFEGIDYIFYREGPDSKYMWDMSNDIYVVVDEGYRDYTLKQFAKYCERRLRLKAFW